MTKSAGSYAFGNFEANQQELDRLKKQASIALELEKSMWSKLSITPELSILDVASGPGITSCELSKLVPQGRVVGVDLSAALVAEANKEKKEQGIENLEFKEASVYELPFENEFDFAYARFLFQHLEKPTTALESVYKSLRNDGRVCIIDVDDRWLSVHPKSQEFEEFAQMAAEGQVQNGGDRYVGRKIGKLMSEAGFKDVRTDIVVVSSQDIGMNNFLNITTGFKFEQFPVELKESAKKKLDEIYSLVQDPHAWGAVGVFMVTGKK